MSFTFDFEQKVKNNFISNGINFQKETRLGIAVSGGADSISLLTSINNILPPENPLYVVSVNHFIRADEETTGDVLFVQNYCKELQKKRKNLVVKVMKLEKGAVSNLQKKMKCGTEDAARRLRYECFEKFITENQLDFLCLAHNKNDQIETIMMRFFQGSQLESLSGIPFKRDKFLRPLINISRNDIEEYLSEKKVSFRTDSTNFDTNYLRNKFRINIIPFLNEMLNGWQDCVISGGEKALEDSKIIDSIVEKIPMQIKDNVVSIKREDFSLQMDGIKRRLLLKAIDLVGENQRVPYVFLKEIIETEKKSNFANKNEIIKEIANVYIIIKKEIILIKKMEKSQTDLFFSAIIKEDGSYDFPFGKISIDSIKNDKSEDLKKILINENETFCTVKYPFVIRNVQTDDFIKTSDNKNKKILKIFSDWHVPIQMRSCLPVIQSLDDENQELICILGKAFGFYNWIVKNQD